MTKTLMAGIDLHSNNVMIGIVDRDGRRLQHQKLACNLELGEQFLSPYKERLNTLPGVGKILGMTITLEVGKIERFATAGDFASYCRAVDARRNGRGTALNVFWSRGSGMGAWMGQSEERPKAGKFVEKKRNSRRGR